MSKFFKWAIDQHRQSVGLNKLEGSTKYKEYAESFPVINGTHREPSGAHMMCSFVRIKYSYSLEHGGYSCVSIGADVGGKRTMLGYAYWSSSCLDDPEPNYVCVGPTYDSRDGEFRPYFMKIDQFQWEYELATRLFIDGHKPYSEVEKLFLDMIKSGYISLNSSAYPPNDDLPIVINNLRIPIQLLVVGASYLLFYRISCSNLGHMSPGYVDILDKILAGLSKDTINIITREHKRGEFHVSLCGQKMVPVHTKELVYGFDYTFSMWREMLISRMVTDLSINFICCGFCMYDQWFYISEIDPNIFENKSMKDNYFRSTSAAKGIDYIRKSRHELRTSPFKNYYTTELEAHIYESLDYANSFVDMSDVVVVHVMERVGMTMDEISSRVESSITDRVVVGGISTSFNEIDHICRHLFELVYGIHCLHSKLGVVHSDLHSNNYTYHEYVPSEYINVVQVISDPSVMYVVGDRGELDSYIFPSKGDRMYIIDFSRCILGPQFSNILESDKFYRDQVNRVMKAFHAYEPEYTLRNQAQIKAVVMARFDRAFPVLCAIDYLAMGASIQSCLKNIVKDPTALEKSLKFAQGIEDLGREFLMNGLHDMINTLNDPVAPGPTIIEKIFYEYRWTPAVASSTNLVDAYSWANDLVYSSSHPDKYPKWADVDQVSNFLGEYTLMDIYGDDVHKSDISTGVDRKFEVMISKKRADQIKLDGDSISTMSSWMEG